MKFDKFGAAYKDSKKTYNYKFFVYPNITYMRDLEKDSYVVVLRNVIREMNKIRDDIHWTILSPMKLANNQIKSLHFPNTTQLKIEFPSYPNAMRTHFDYNNFMKALDWKNNEYDVVYSHLPEHTNLLANAIGNNTNMDPKYIGGYCHWFEVDENTAYNNTLFRENISGILEMEECGVNSEWLKNLVIDRSKEFYNNKVAKKLQKIIQPHYLGIDDISTGHEYKPKTILFNHRDNEYTGWRWFIKRMDELWEKRKDFKVYTTLADIPKIKKKDKDGEDIFDEEGNHILEDRPYAERVKLSSRDDYLNFVRSMHMGIGCFQKYSAWSISTTDGLSQGVPYVLPNGMCYPEMVGNDYPLLYDGAKEFKSTIEDMLDNPKVREEANNYLDSKLDNFKWSGRVPTWFNNWKFLDNLKMVKSDTEGYQKIFNLIKRKGYATKRDVTNHLNWGVRISFTGYRNRLRTEPLIRFTKNGYEYIGD